MSNLANMYYLRDCEMKLDPQEMILYSMKKLGYYNINKPELLKNYIKDKQIIMIKDDSYDDDINIIKNSTEYLNYNNYIDKKISRSLELQKYLKTLNIEEFYKECTDDELIYLGY